MFITSMPDKNHPGTRLPIKMIMPHLFLSSLIIILSLTSCYVEDKKSDVLTLCSWNVQNLFNASEDGNEYGDYLPSSGWTEKSYQSRLSNISKVCSYEALSGTDVFIFNEVENNSVVEDIINLQFFRKNKFVYFATAGEDGGAIRTAVISKIPIVGIRIHNNPCRLCCRVEYQRNHRTVGKHSPSSLC